MPSARRSPTRPGSPATPSPPRTAGPSSRSRRRRTPGLSNRTVRYVHTIIHAALRDALRWNRVTRNVADAATPPPEASTRRGRHTTWTGEQLGRFLDFVADSPYLPAWLFLATSGSRRGEVLGLKWEDVDLDDATAIMSRQICMVDHLVVIKELPKTKGGHTIRSTRHRRDARDLQVRQAELKLLLGAGYHDDGWIFCRPDGTPIHPERFSREFLRKQEPTTRPTPTSRSRG
jgi:integrase